MSLRKLAELNNVKSASALIRVAREEGWDQLRKDYQTRSTDKTLELLADHEARRSLRVAEVVEDTIDMVGEAVNQVRGRMKQLRPVIVGKTADGEDIVEYDPELKVSPKDLGNLLKGLSEIPGVAPKREEAKPGGTTINVPDGTDIAFMARFVRDVRSRGGPTDRPLGEVGLPGSAEGAG